MGRQQDKTSLKDSKWNANRDLQYHKSVCNAKTNQGKCKFHSSKNQQQQKY